MSENQKMIDSFTSSLNPLFLEVLSLLDAHNFSKGKISYPVLYEQLKTKINCTDDDINENNLIIRQFVNTSGKYISRRGKCGGIDLVSNVTKSSANKVDQKVKDELKIQIEKDLAIKNINNKELNEK